MRAPRRALGARPVKPARLVPVAEAWPALSPLLDEALELPPDEREAWLEALPGLSASFRQTLRSLLTTQAGLEGDDFLGELPALPLRPSPDGAVEGALVGPYRLISKIGQGGMATVWRAERIDGLVRRPVALKLPVVAWGDAFAARLDRERDILASLTHKHIARLLDAGVDAQGRPFFAMESIVGEPIDAYCRAHALPMAGRVELLLQVMAAMAHAHAQLVVHRDLKPSNILVNAEGQVALLDFGIAKLLLDSGSAPDSALTQAAGHVLTPDYASPEQIRGEPLGTASDIYSIGIVAYEVLSGERPYRLPQGPAARLAEAIAATSPPPASQAVRAGGGDPGLQRQLRGDLDAILHKALKPSPQDRYGSMDAFAQDLSRWRDGEPVLARPDSAAYRAAKFIGRYRVQVVAASVAVAALVTGSSVAWWQAREALAQARLARTEAATARAVQTFLESVFNANSGNQTDPQAARQTPARDLLDRGAERIETELADAPEARLRLYQSLQEMYVHMALNDRAAALQRKSLALASQLHGPQSPQAIEAATWLAKTLLEMNQRDEAKALLLSAEAATHRAGGIAPLLELFIAQSLSFLHVNDDPAQALTWARRAALLARNQPVSQDTINALQLLGEACFKMGLYPEAEQALKAAEAQIARHPQAGEGGLPLVLATLGASLSRQGRPEEAERALQRALELAERLAEPYSLRLVSQKISQFQIDNGLLGEAMRRAGADHAWAHEAGPEFGALPQVMARQYARALLAYGQAAQALQVIDGALSPKPALSSDLLSGLLVARADALVALGRAPAAEGDLEQALRVAGPQGTVLDDARAARRRWWVAIGQPGLALQDLRAAEAPPPSTDRPASAALGKPNAGHLASTKPDAQRTASSALGTPTRGVRLPALPVLRHEAEAAQLLAAAGESQAAIARATAALATLATLPERRFARLSEAELEEALGRGLRREGRTGDAVDALTRAVALRRALHDPQRSDRLAQALEAEADALAAHDRPDAARAAAAEALAVRRRGAEGAVSAPTSERGSAGHTQAVS